MSPRGTIRVSCLFLLGALLMPGQTGTGNIQGIVKDATGAVISQGAVTATHTATSTIWRRCATCCQRWWTPIYGISARGSGLLFAYPELLRLFVGNTQNTLPGQGNISYDPNAAEQSPDGLPNYWLRSVPNVVAGVNSNNFLDATRITGITRGSGVMYYLDPRQPTARAHQWNLLVEREVRPASYYLPGAVPEDNRARNRLLSP